MELEPFYALHPLFLLDGIGVALGTHQIAAGETLTGIAGRFGLGVREIAAANQIADPNRIFAGTVLTIPGGWLCPVQGARTFVNDYGLTKPGGRFHDGVDLFAARGTPVVAPVAGRVEQVRGTRAGLQFRLHGVDGHVYIGTHMDSFGASGQVRQGEALGTVGTTGNALGTSPHLHFEVHLGGQRITNPYPSLRTACR
jgi:peptidoglycan LD-endopeptidase LytH